MIARKFLRQNVACHSRRCGLTQVAQQVNHHLGFRLCVRALDIGYGSSSSPGPAGALARFVECHPLSAVKYSGVQSEIVAEAGEGARVPVKSLSHEAAGQLDAHTAYLHYDAAVIPAQTLSLKGTSCLFERLLAPSLSAC